MCRGVLYSSYKPFSDICILMFFPVCGLPVHCMIMILRKDKTSLVAQILKQLSTMLETRVRSLGWEDPLEKEMATHSNTIAWKIPWMEEPGRLQSMQLQRVGHDWATSLFFRGKTLLILIQFIVFFYICYSLLHKKFCLHSGHVDIVPCFLLEIWLF